MATFRYLFLQEEFEVLTEDGKTLKEICTNETCKFYDADGNPVELGDIQVKTRTFKATPFARMPATGFSHEDNHSLSSIIWLEHESRVRGIPIRHARNGGEHRVPNGKSPPGWYKLDGYNFNEETEQETAFEFFGCVFHACPWCFPESSSGTGRRLLHHQPKNL